MLNIRQVKHLARSLGLSAQDLLTVAENADTFCEELILVDPAKPKKEREVVNVRGKLRRLEVALLKNILERRISSSPFSHGGVRGCSIKSNFQPHRSSQYALLMDIRDFYPSITNDRVYRLYTRSYGCSPDVARICTRLCTYRYHLALGLVSSPFLANQVLGTIDRRIAHACQKLGLIYTRFVDDIAISGPFNLSPDRSGVAGLVERILNDHGLRIHGDKRRHGRLADGLPITGVRMNRGHIDVKRDFICELERQIADARNLAAGRHFDGPYYTRGQVEGRVRFVCWVNRGRRQPLLRAFSSVRWAQVHANAAALGLVRSEKILKKKQPSDQVLAAHGTSNVAVQ